MQKAPLKGVNLGGWLIAERWMTPSVFAGTNTIDEYTLSQTPGGRSAIKAHRDGFIQESDFAWLEQHGITIVRIPVGYWIFDGDGPLLPHTSYVDWAMTMAHRYHLKVIVDLHGLEGSQNGKYHSGRIGKATWFKYKEYRTRTLSTLRAIAKRYKDHPQLWGIQIVNEPKFGVFHFKLRTYYREAFRVLEKILKPDTYIIYSDGFTPRLLSGALGRTNRVIMDVHLYHTAKPWTKYTSLSLYYRILKLQKRLIKRLSKTQTVIVGEWSGVFRQPIFNSAPASEHARLIEEHARKQIESFAHAKAWFYWNYKTEKPGVWDFRSQVEAGIIAL